MSKSGVVLAILLVLASSVSALEFSPSGELVSSSDDLLLMHFNGDASDASGLGNSGVVSGADCNAEGKFGKGCSFDGDNDYVSLGNLDLDGEEFTISMWAKANSFIPGGLYYGDNRLISKASGQDEQDHYFMVSSYNDGSGIKLRFRLKTDTTSTLIANSGDLSTDKWFHVAAVYDGTRMKLYKNGVSIGSIPKSGMVAKNPGVSIRVGVNPDGYAPWNGDIDELVIFKRALSGDEINELYKAVPSQVCVESWQCSDWSACVGGQQTRTCSDLNACGTVAGKPAETQTCSAVCVQNWSCGEWGECNNLTNAQSRVCVDQNNCGNLEGKPSESKICGGVCFEDWRCSEWGTCEDGKQIRACADLNGCGTILGKPDESKDCSGEECVENWQCGEWGACEDGEQTRTCSDLNSCGTVVKKPDVDRGCVIIGENVTGECSLVGYRENGNYCTADLGWAPQRADDAMCENDFECGSNYCKLGSCVSSSLWEKFLSWVGGVFSIFSAPMSEPGELEIESGLVQSGIGDLTIDPSRLPDIHAYDRIPVDTSDWTVVQYSGPRTGEGVKAAINSAAPKTIIDLPDGVYSGEIVHKKSEVVVRGNCEDRSRVVWRHSGNAYDGAVWDNEDKMLLCGNGWISMCGADFGDHYRSTMMTNRKNWYGPYTRGTSTLNLQSTNGLAVGDIVLMESNPVIPSDESASLEPSAPNDPNLNKTIYIAKIASISGNSITLDRTLPINFGSVDAWVSKAKMQQHAGVECLTLDQEDPWNPDSKGFSHHASFGFENWIYNVDFGDTFNNFGPTNFVVRAVYMNNRFGEQYKSLQGDGKTCDGSNGVDNNPCWNKMVMAIGRTYDSSFINNVIHSSIGFQPVSGASRNWIAYNYFPTPQYHPFGAEWRRALFFHGGYSHDNVVEGNRIYGSIEMDQIWGGQGPSNTFFRNVVDGGEGRYHVETQLNTDTTIRVSKRTAFILNYGRAFQHSLNAWRGLDSRANDMHIERNVYTENFNVNDETSKNTVSVNNYDASNSPLGNKWSSFSFPDTLNKDLTSVPSFWCQETVSNGGQVCDFGIHSGVGAMWDGSCKLPAQVIAEGGTCTPIGSDCTVSGCAPTGSACSYNYCNPSTKLCELRFNPGSTICDDGNSCTGGDHCSGTSDQCAGANLPDGTSCPDDGVACTLGEQCTSGSCAPTVLDNSLCTAAPGCSGVMCTLNGCESTGCPVCKTSQNNVWLSESFTEQTGTFTVEFDATPLASGVSGLVTLSDVSPTSFPENAVLVGFNQSGYINARNGGKYDSEIDRMYVVDTSYHFRIVVDLQNKNYDAYVTPEGEAEFLLASDYAFRTEKQGVGHLDNWAVISDLSGKLIKVCNFRLNGASLEKGVIPIGSGNPFYIVSGNPATNNPISCGVMAGGDECVVSWKVNATGAIGSSWNTFSIAQSSSLINNSEIIVVTITESGISCTDGDGDGYNINGGECGQIDCDDSNSFVYPGASELCDGVDNDCDSYIDEGCGSGSWDAPIGIPDPEFGIEQTAIDGDYTYYVKRDGICSDSGTGSPASPRCTIPSVLVAGDVVEIHGVYDPGAQIRIQNARGSFDSPIFIRGVSGERAVIKRPIYIEPSGTDDVSYLILENLDINGSNAGTAKPKLSVNQPTHHFVLRNSEIHDSAQTGFAIGTFGTGVSGAAAHDIIVYNNKIYNLAEFDSSGNFPPGQNDFHGVKAQNLSWNVWVIDNEIYRVNGDSVQTEKAEKVFIGRNVFHSNGEGGTDFKIPRDHIVSENVYYDFTSTLVSGVGGGFNRGTAASVHANTNYDTSDWARGNYIWFIANEIYDSGTGIDMGSADNLFAIGNVIYDIKEQAADTRQPYDVSRRGTGISASGNNIGLYSNDVYDIVLGVGIASSSSGVKIANNIINKLASENNYYGSMNGGADLLDHNLLYSSGGGKVLLSGTHYSNLDDLKSAGKCNYCIGQDPAFVDAASYNFKLSESSPAIDAGESLSSVTSLFESRYGENINFDFEGNARPQGTSYDIGSFEFVGTSLPCELSNARWSVSSADVGQKVNLIVDGQNCAGEEANYSIYEPRWWWYDKKVYSADGSLSVEWDAGKDNLGDLHEGTYYFVASLTSNPDETETSGNLQVSLICVDGDGDGFSVTGGSCGEIDCDDSDSLEFPGQTWYKDIDHDGFSDGLSLVQCLRPTDYFAVSELYLPGGDCEDSDQNVFPGADEICNGVDDDCDIGTSDGLDESWFGNPTSCGLGVCESSGQLVCLNGAQSNTCSPLANQTGEMCDGLLDDDCDGTVDEECGCTVGETRQCGESDVGACSYGVQTCDLSGVWGECVGAIYPVDEFCNGVDDDCDSVLDNGGSALCSDGIGCTTDVCLGTLGCSSSEDNSVCQNGLWCDGEEVCSVSAGGCVAGTSVVCNDGYECTSNSCNEISDSCNYVEEDSYCVDNSLGEICSVESFLPPTGCGYLSCVDSDGDGIFDFDSILCSTGKDVCPWTNDQYFADNPSEILVYAPETGNYVISSFVGLPLSAGNLSISLSGVGSIAFNEKVELVLINESGCFQKLNLSEVLAFEDKSIYLNSSYAGLNKSANLTFMNVSYNAPKVLLNGKECNGACNVMEYSVGSLNVSVSGFSRYDVIEGEYCGDGMCNGGESCSSCSTDCGACDGGKKGGGGSGRDKIKKDDPPKNVKNTGLESDSCVPLWICSEWGPCDSLFGLHYRSCVDLNGCGDLGGEPDLSEVCLFRVLGENGTIPILAPKGRGAIYSIFVFGVVVFLSALVWFFVRLKQEKSNSTDSVQSDGKSI